MSDENRHGRFVWFDLMTTDPEAAVEFYGAVVGWGTTQWEEGETPYTMWTHAENSLGGVMALPEEARNQGAPPHWMAYVSTQDVDATLKQAETLGGKTIHPGTDIPGAGRFGVFADPQGATIATHASDQAPVPDKAPVPGTFSWHELITTDYKGAMGFYGKLFGWQAFEAVDMGPAGIYQMYGHDPQMPLGGMFNKSPDMPMPPCWLYYIMVEDLNRAVDIAKQRGAQVLNGPMEVPGGDHICQLTDPQGVAFALHQKG